ncbi:small ribosomal subunit Rsm22 family protein [Terracoccus sp. 273MFTsu3.1]|uniref:small ribosomal subunit Rsm22 family protein n=1 Tax=Terracoccus sp. 273MFTsu3.1 TaxID=1172188 RepID=UPI00039E2DB5|nr:small ribosomal subunit Rsm22 family protein [Terracoccus sp. 273MFTsu3.1]
MSRTPAYAAELRTALSRAARGVDERELTRATEALVSRYRSVAPASAPILASRVHVAAYAAYRMPATHAALSRVMADLADRGLAPRSLLDLGGGTGAAAWAAAGAFDSLESVTVLDQVEDALTLGRDLVADAASPALRGATFRRAVAGAWPQLEADLVTVSYVLSELDERQQDGLVADAMRLGRAVVVAEPGTPDGYARVLRVRSALLAAGWTLLGPCPHSMECPLAQGDWCHFAARVSRSAEHRRLKGAELSYEDEKFSWVAAAAPGVLDSPTREAISGRILRHPLKRKGLVEFQVCRPDGTAGREVVSKKAGERYRRARDAEWGDALP